MGKKASIPMKKIIQETMAEEMDSLGFRMVQGNLLRGITWVRLLDQNRVVQMYRIRFTPLKGETEMEFLLKPLFFPEYYVSVNGEKGVEAWRGIRNIMLYIYKKIGKIPTYPFYRHLEECFFNMRDSKDVNEFVRNKMAYTTLILDAYTFHAKPHFLQGTNIESSIAECEKISEIICRPWKDARGKPDFNFNGYYISDYLYALIYLGEGIDKYFEWVERYIGQFYDFYQFECKDFDETIAHYKAKDTEYFMKRYKNAQEGSAEKLAALLGVEKEEFPYIPPLKELKIG